ncbi:hypothetical protein F4778DRAFT_735867 [Xylariomycetidae sp. FL2044]|nr:hypothetical protein F4778DRAFT_735867 [Xylariomycetidae sp. FL2044]
MIWISLFLSLKICFDVISSPACFLCFFFWSPGSLGLDGKHLLYLKDDWVGTCAGEKDGREKRGKRETKKDHERQRECLSILRPSDWRT